MAGRTREETLSEVIEGVKLIRESGSSDDLDAQLYVPDTRLKGILGQLFEYVSKGKSTTAEQREAGNLLEQLAYLAFAGLTGYERIESFNSAGPQFDLLATGSSSAWMFLCASLHVDDSKRGMLVECKARTSKVDDQDFGRFCALMRGQEQSVGLGVFLTLKGATGFPTPGRAEKKIYASRLRQVLFFARYRTPVVVLDWADCQELVKAGALVRILRSRIENVEKLPCEVGASPLAAIPLPKHLQGLAKGRGARSRPIGSTQAKKDA